MQEFCEPMATYVELGRRVTGFSEKTGRRQVRAIENFDAHFHKLDSSTFKDLRPGDEVAQNSTPLRIGAVGNAIVCEGYALGGKKTGLSTTRSLPRADASARVKMTKSTGV